MSTFVQGYFPEMLTPDFWLRRKSQEKSERTAGTKPGRARDRRVRLTPYCVPELYFPLTRRNTTTSEFVLTCLKQYYLL
jgi:hypothetical protein